MVEQRIQSHRAGKIEWDSKGGSRPMVNAESGRVKNIGITLCKALMVSASCVVGVLRLKVTMCGLRLLIDEGKAWRK